MHPNYYRSNFWKIVKFLENEGENFLSPKNDISVKQYFCYTLLQQKLFMCAHGNQLRIEITVLN